MLLIMLVKHCRTLHAYKTSGMEGLDLTHNGEGQCYTLRCLRQMPEAARPCMPTICAISHPGKALVPALCLSMQVRDILNALSGGHSAYPAAPLRERQEQQDGNDTDGKSLRHLLDESKESLIEAERAFLSKALALLQACPHQHLRWHSND